MRIVGLIFLCTLLVLGCKKEPSQKDPFSSPFNLRERGEVQGGFTRTEKQRKARKTGPTRMPDHFGKAFIKEERGELSSPFSFAVGKQRERTELASSFSRKQRRSKKRGELPSAFSSKLNKPLKREELASSFSKPFRTKNRVELPSAFSSPFKGRERGELPSAFSSPIGRKKERTEQADHFSKAVLKRERGELSDHFGRETRRVEHGALSDHFSSAAGRSKRSDSPDHFKHGQKQKEHSEKDLQTRGDQRRIWRLNHVGEPLRFFERDPNRKKSMGRLRREQRKKKKGDPFSRKRKHMDQPQMPRGEGDLFPGGVLPKMKDMR